LNDVKPLVIEMPAQTAAQNVAKAGASVICYVTDFEAKAQVRVGRALQDVQKYLVKPATNALSILGRSNQGTGLTGRFH
jgi:hypothetical protein